MSRSTRQFALITRGIGRRRETRHSVAPRIPVIIYVRFFVKEPAVWVENRRLQRTQHREVRVPLFSIFKRAMLGNTLTACWWMASAFVVGYSILALFPT
jgi:SHS family lactate transporter-like MFS transporter